MGCHALQHEPNSVNYQLNKTKAACQRMGTNISLIPNPIPVKMNCHKTMMQSEVHSHNSNQVIRGFIKMIIIDGLRFGS